VEILAGFEGHPVAIREGGVLACAFHPELTDDPRLHALFMAMTTGAASAARVSETSGDH
jgi:5'-phosphate synthase pdxT subunit